MKYRNLAIWACTVFSALLLAMPAHAETKSKTATVSYSTSTISAADYQTGEKNEEKRQSDGMARLSVENSGGTELLPCEDGSVPIVPEEGGRVPTVP